MKRKFFYAYKIENECSGIVDKWEECGFLVKGKNAKYKKFKTKNEAELWLKSGGTYDKKINSKVKNLANQKDLEKGIYFDSGTGRGQGVEVRITDKMGASLFEKFNMKTVNKYGNYNLGFDVTNNYGELFACQLALKFALKLNEKKVFGDSKLILDFWSKGIFKKDLPKKTIELIKKVKILREEFEKSGGVLDFVSGDINPADLGFHKSKN
jgi:ribonuclease H-related protein